jgi:hypothetical protein
MHKRAGLFIVGLSIAIGACSDDTLPLIVDAAVPLDGAVDTVADAPAEAAADSAAPADLAVEPDANTDAPTPPPSWQTRANPSSGTDAPIGIAVDDTGLYVLGRVDFGLGRSERWRLEKRAPDSGTLLWDQEIASDTGIVRAFALGVDPTGVYVGGWGRANAQADPHWVLEKRGRIDGELDLGFGVGGVVDLPARLGGIIALVVDATGLYLLGTDAGLANFGWRLEKRDPSTGAAIALFGGDGSVTTEVPTAATAVKMAADAGSLYVLAGDASAALDWKWVVEKRSKVNGAPVGAFGANGRAIDNPTAAIDAPLDLAVHGDALFVVGADQSLGDGDRQWRLQRWNKATGEVQWNQASNPTSPDALNRGGSDFAFGVAAHGSGLYVVGSADVPTDGRGRLEKRDLASGAVVGTPASFNPSAFADALTHVVVVGPSLYLAGVERVTRDDQAWLIARRPRP